MKTRESPCTERYARWCERSGDSIEFPSYSIVFVLERRMKAAGADYDYPLIDLLVESIKANEIM